MPQRKLTLRRKRRARHSFFLVGRPKTCVCDLAQPNGRSGAKKRKKEKKRINSGTRIKRRWQRNGTNTSRPNGRIPMSPQHPDARRDLLPKTIAHLWRPRTWCRSTIPKSEAQIPQKLWLLVVVVPRADDSRRRAHNHRRRAGDALQDPTGVVPSMATWKRSPTRSYG